MLKKSALLLGVLAACQSASSPDPSREALVEPRPVTPLAHEVYTGFNEPAHFAVRDARRWTEVWSRTFAGRSEVPERPAIDFSTEMVLVAAQGPQGSSGYDISIDRVSSKGGSITVDVTATSPDQRCVLLAVLTSPVVMARVPAERGSVQFVRHSRITSCE